MAAKTTKSTEARLADRTRNAGAVSPGHPDWDQARGVQPRQPPKVIDRALVSDPRGLARSSLLTGCASPATGSRRTRATESAAILHEKR